MSDDTGHTGLLYTDGESGSLRTRRFQVVVVSGPDAGAGVDVEGGTVLIGTHPTTDLRLSDRGVSRYHLELQLRADGLKVTDLDTTNGTFQGTTRIGSVVLAGQSRLRLGSDTEIEVAPADTLVSTGQFPRDRFGAALGGSADMRSLFGLLDRVAASDIPVLLEGEVGVGKGVLARAIHDASPRHKGPFVTLDCRTLTEESGAREEVFGALGPPAARGVVDEAEGGTLYLDEVGALPPALQPALERLIERGELRRVGDVRARKANVRIVASTARQLADLVRRGQVREELYRRLAAVRALVPPLRRRKEDLPLLARHFLDGTSRDFELPPDTLALLMAYDWPGNVRELRAVVEHGLSFENVPSVSMAAVGEATGEAESPPLAGPGGRAELSRHDDVLNLPFKEAKHQLVESFEKAYLTHLLKRHHGNISRAAHEAGIDRNYIHRLVKKYGIPVDRD